MGFTKIIFDSERIMIEMKKGRNKNIENDKLDLAIKIFNEFIVNNELESPEVSSWKEKLYNNLMDNVYNGEMLGEECAEIRSTMRPLYFGLKNIILKEIHNID